MACFERIYKRYFRPPYIQSTTLKYLQPVPPAGQAVYTGPVLVGQLVIEYPFLWKKCNTIVKKK